MKHLGDITKINGHDVPPVDVITGGSPCQDLSVAGKRAGLDGERSGLFMEQIRIVKEMREADEQRGRTGVAIRPRFMVWENVPGAFSSNGGRDFQAVLTEIVRIAEPSAPDVPMPDKGKWTKSGCLYDEMGGWSVAWRLHDAQFWGVPQRRARIALVADFGGLAAPEVLFERKGLSGHTRASGEAGQNAAAGAQGSTRISSCSLQGNDRGNANSFQERAGKPGGGKGILIQEDRVGALSTLNNQSVYFVREKAPTLRADMGDNQTSVLCLNDQGGSVMGVSEDVTGALRAEEHGHQPIVWNGKADGASGNGVAFATVGDHENRPTDMTNIVIDTHHPALCMDVGFFSTHEEVAGSLLARQYKDSPITVGTLCAESYPGKLAHQDFLSGLYPVQQSVVRRLTPLECERLQGFPDGWTDIGEWTDSKGKKHKESDGPRYKALGNSIALPFWKVLAKRISAQYDRDITMASLFDGIGGFPLVFEQINGKGTALWASEIEEFPMAVTRRRFPDADEEV